MKRKPAAGAAMALALFVLLAPAAGAKDRVLTLYSPKIETMPYVHDSHHVGLKADGRQAPAKPGYVLGFEEMVLVDSKRPNAKPLPASKMMVHHLLYFAPGRVDQLSGSCWQGAGFIIGRGEEHPVGGVPRRVKPKFWDRYGINNRRADGSAPDWRLTAMVMNHYKRPKSFYVRAKVRYTTEKRESATPLIIGNCAQLLKAMAYDIPGGGKPGSSYVDSSTWTAPFSGRLLSAWNHQHGGGKYQTLSSVTCDRRLFKAPVYHGTANHLYNTIRPILHEPGPIGTGAYGTMEGVPIVKGEVLRRRAVHDNGNLHVDAMGFWGTLFIEDNSVKRCGRMPGDLTEINRPKRYDRTPNYGLVVPQLFKPRGGFAAFDGNPLAIGDDFFGQGKVTARVGETVSWSFGGTRPHSVTVANGPRGFSSGYGGKRSGTYSVTPTVKGTYRLVCQVHPTTMAQTLKVK